MKKYFQKKIRQYAKPELVIYPRIKDQKVLSDILFKASYMFPEKFIFYSGLKLSQVTLPDYLGEIKLSNNTIRVNFFHILYLILSFRMILVWESTNWLRKWMTRLPHVFNVDKICNCKEGSVYFSVYNYIKEKPTVRQFPFNEMVKKQKCYIFGTGESLSKAYNYKFDDGYRLVCNSMIRDLQLMNHIQPDFLIFADAIFHFGPSKYAYAFRAALKVFVKSFPQCQIIIPELMYNHLVDQSPTLRKNIFCIPANNTKIINLDLVKNYTYSNFDNVLNILLLPIASTLADEIYLFGFDGRGKKSDRFWNYYSKANFENLLSTQEKAHPGFFKDQDYREYFARTSTQTERIIKYGEMQGMRYFSLTPSFYTALSSRMIKGVKYHE